MMTGVAERHLVELGSFEVQVHVGFPGEPDAPVDLECGLRHAHAGVAAPDLRGRGGHRGVGVVGTDRPCGVVHRRAHAFDVDKYVGAAVLDRLEAADGPSELLAFFGVLDSETHHGLGAAEHLRGMKDRAAAPVRGHVCHITDHGRRRVVEIDPRELAGLVHRRLRRTGDIGEVHCHEFVAGGNDEYVGQRAVDHRLRTTGDTAVAVALDGAVRHRRNPVAGEKLGPLTGVRHLGDGYQLLEKWHRREMGASLFE